MTIKFVEVCEGIVVAGPFESSSLPDMAESVSSVIDITGGVPVPQEGWKFDKDTGLFTEASRAPTPPISTETLREIRDEELALSDWRDLPSYAGSDQAAWRAYRKALRDITVDYVPVIEPTFPTKPS